MRADSNPQSWWDSPALVRVLVVVTLLSLIAAGVIDGHWRARLERYERARIAAVAHAASVPLAAKRRPTPSAPARTVYVSELTPSRVIDPPEGGLALDAAPWGGPLLLRGVKVPRGIVMRPGANGRASVEYALDGRYASFEVRAAMIDSPCQGRGSVMLHVYVDDELRFETRALRAGEDGTARLSVSGAGTLRLEVDDRGDGNECDYGAWLNPYLVPDRAPGSR